MTPMSVQTESITSAVTKISVQFALSWEYPWEESQSSCKPSVSIIDDLNTVAYQNNIGELSWILDNKLIAIPDTLVDNTEPVMEAVEGQLFLRQGDEFSISGSIVYAGSAVPISEIPDGLTVEAVVIYGSQSVSSDAGVTPESRFTIDVALPDRVPLSPYMGISVEVMNVPGLGSSESLSLIHI